MKVKMRLLALLLVCALLLPATVLAVPPVPGLPLTFSGAVTIQSANAPVGTIVTAEILGTVVATNAPTGITVAGQWGLAGIPWDDQSPGKIITFKVNGEVGGTYVIAGQGAVVDDLDLDVSDTTGPTVTAKSPTGRNEPVDTVVTATFSEPMDETTIDESSFTVTGSSVAGSVSYDAGSLTATFTPDEDLDYDHRYTVNLSTGITDIIGNALTGTRSWTFTTGRPSGWNKCGPIDLVIILDVTGSMGGALDTVIAALADIIDEAVISSGDDLRMGYITFDGGGLEGFGGEEDQEYSEGFGSSGIGDGDWVTVVSELTDDIDAVKASIEATSLGWGGGGPEASDEAKNTAVNNLAGGNRADPSGFVGTQIGDFTEPYRSNALKLAVLITDAEPGGFNDVWDEADTDAVHEHALSARHNDILVSDVYIGSDSTIAAIFEDDALTTGGVFVQTSDGSDVGDAILDILAVCGAGEEPEDEDIIVPEEEVVCVAPVAEPAQMSIQNIYCDPEQATQNIQVEVWVSVGNSGGTKGTKSVGYMLTAFLKVVRR